jgi:AcrR family transcriptional regulator
MVEIGDADAVSMRAIATAVGVTPPAIYAHFTDKDELFQGLCDRRFAQLNEVFQEAIGSSSDPLERLMLCGRAYVRFGLENPEAYRFLMMTRSSEEAEVEPVGDEPAQGDIAFMTLVELVSACIDSGHIRPSDPLESSLIIWAMVHGLTALMITAPNHPTRQKFDWPDDIIDKMMVASMEGMAPR